MKISLMKSWGSNKKKSRDSLMPHELHPPPADTLTRKVLARHFCPRECIAQRQSCESPKGMKEIWFLRPIPTMLLQKTAQFTHQVLQLHPCPLPIYRVERLGVYVLRDNALTSFGKEHARPANIQPCLSLSAVTRPSLFIKQVEYRPGIMAGLRYRGDQEQSGSHCHKSI